MGIQASSSERYRLSELKSDLWECQARHVQLIVDQSYGGEVVRRLKRGRGQRADNIAVFASSKDNEYSFDDDFTAAWTRQNHTKLCTKDVFAVRIHFKLFSVPPAA